MSIGSIVIRDSVAPCSSVGGAVDRPSQSRRRTSLQLVGARPGSGFLPTAPRPIPPHPHHCAARQRDAELLADKQAGDETAPGPVLRSRRLRALHSSHLRRRRRNADRSRRPGRQVRSHRPGSARFGPFQPGSARFSPVQSGSVRFSPVQPGSARRRSTLEAASHQGHGTSGVRFAGSSTACRIARPHRGTRGSPSGTADRRPVGRSNDRRNAEGKRKDKQAGIKIHRNRLHTTEAGDAGGCR